MNEIISIKLSQLTISPMNVRVVGASKQDDKELTASIRAKGILQNLVVVPEEGQGDRYEVIAGGRRFAVLTNLHSAGEIDGDYLVPCTVRELDEAVEISLGENIKADMHPADVFMAFKRLADGGLKEKEIAERLGRSQAEVKRLLKLGTVAPELVEHFRNGKLDLDCIMAFTVNDNQERQLACFAELSRGYMDSRRIKNYLLGEAISSKSREAKFVGVSAYKKAGGTISTDLFSEESFWNDAELVNQLIDDRLTKEAKKFEKDWAWVETSRLGWEAKNGYFTIEGKHVDVPQKLDDQIAAVEKRLNELEDMDMDEEWTDEQDEEFRKLEDQLGELQEKRDTYIQFTAEQREVAGVIITFDYDGKLSVSEGMVKKSDKKRIDAIDQDGDDDEEGISVSRSSESERIESNALFSDLNAYYGQAFQVHLLQHEATCFDLLIYSMAFKVLSHMPCWDRLASIDCNAERFTALGIEETKAADTMKAAELSLNAAWVEIDDPAERFTAFQALSKKDKMKLMTFCVARSSVAGIGRGRAQQTLVAEQTQFNLADYWLPTSEIYFSRIKRDDLMAIGVSLSGEDFANNNAKAKKGELAEHIAELPERGAWLPEVMNV